MVRVMCGVQFKDRKRLKNLMLMLGVNVTMDQFAMKNGVYWYGLRDEVSRVLRRGLDFKVDGQWKKW